MHLRHLCWDICWESPVTHHHYMGASENCFTAMHVSAKENTEAAGYGHTCLILLTLRAVSITQREMRGEAYSLKVLDFEIWENHVHCFS